MEKDIKKEIRTIRVLLSFLVGVLFIYLIAILSSLLIPLFLALFIALILQPVLAWLERKSIPFSVSLILISSATIGILFLFSRIFISTYESLLKEKNRLTMLIRNKVESILSYFSQLTGIETTWQSLNTDLKQLLSYDWLLDSSGAFATFLSDLTGSFVLTLLYLIAFLGGILQYESYLDYLSENPDKLQENKILKGFEQVKGSIVTYMKVKFLASLFTGIGFWLVSWGFGVHFSMFWGFLAFILNFIPNIGSIVATIPPLLLGLIEIESTGKYLFFAIMLIAAQFYFGNIFEPKFMGRSLSINTVTIILGLVFWGKLWGITGMLLSVPLLVLLKVILSQIPDARFIVKLMGTYEETRNRKP